MQLDYNPETKLYFVRVPRVVPAGEISANSLMFEYGLDFSTSASTPQEAVLFTGSPYAAATFVEHGTPAAREALSAISTEVARSRSITATRHIEVPDDEELAPYQIADLDYMLDRARVLDADEPGLGKTPTAICYANEIHAKRVLVVCPAAIRHQWCDRIGRWSTMGKKYQVPSLNVYAIISSRYGVDPTAAWTVVSYDLARQPGILAALRKQHFDLGIFDEIHFAKELTSKRSRALWGGGDDPLYNGADGLPLADCCEHVVTLSGTPMPNRPREIYSLGRHLDWAAFDYQSEDRFTDRFNPTEIIEVTKKDGTKVRVIDERSGRHSELQNRLRANFMCRHLKREVLTQLKMPVYDLIHVSETEAVRRALEAENLLGIDPEDILLGTLPKGATGGEELGHITTARRLMGEAIAPQAAEWIKYLLDVGEEEKLVIFYWFIQCGNIIEAALAPWLERRHQKLVRIDGSTSAGGKNEKVKQFVNDPAYQVCMGNVLSLGTGTDDLQHVANHALIIEPDWVPGNNIQCVDRLDRWGQKRTVLADIFVAEHSIAERVLSSALRKARVTHNSLDRRFA